MTINYQSGALLNQGANVAVAEALGNAARLGPRRVSCGSLKSPYMPLIRREDMHHAMAMLAAIDSRHDQAIPKHFFLVRHLGPTFSAPKYRAISPPQRPVTEVRCLGEGVADV